jgi:hypothetical protein
MVGPTRIDLHTLNLDELVGVVNLYPWYGIARLELCRRMSRMGDTWDDDQYAPEALYLPDRGLLVKLLKRTRQADYSDKDVQELLASYLEPATTGTEQPVHQVHVVGGDYFSQAQYDNVKKGSDSIFSRFAVKMRSETPVPEEDLSPVSERFATETLARIFVEQGRPEEAKRIYSRLILDFPEKSAYFASLIDSLGSETNI